MKVVVDGVGLKLVVVRVCMLVWCGLWGVVCVGVMISVFGGSVGGIHWK